MKRPIESDYISQIAYTRDLEVYCDWLTHSTWVGLTEDEIQTLLSENRFAVFALIRAVESKLKEKNT